MFERELRDLAFVPRWGIVRCIRRQNVAEHSFYVAIYADQIAELIGWQGDRAALLRYALAHDWDEILTSDIAAPAKRVLKQAAGSGWDKFFEWLQACMYQRLGKDEYDRWTDQGYAHKEIEQIVKISDLLEAVMYLAEEMNMGNNNMGGRFSYLYKALQAEIEKMLPNPVDSLDLRTAIQDAVSTQQLGQSRVVTGHETF